MKTRYKVLIWLAVLGVVYVAVAVAAWRIMPGKIADAESKRPGISMALAKIANDQLTVSQRITEITSKTLGKGRDKAAQVSELLGDPTLNRMALTYTGADWATAYSGFSGNVKHMRDRLAVRKEDRKDSASKEDEKIRELESRRQHLMHSIESRVYVHKKRQWEEELADIDRQLNLLRSGSRYRDRIAKRGSSAAVQEAATKVNDELFKLASEYEAQTVGQLVQIMAAQATALRYEEAEPERLRHRMSVFNIWPLNKLSAMPL